MKEMQLLFHVNDCDNMVYVIKADGSRQPFEKNKIVGTCMRAGVSKETANEIANTISKKVHENMTTHEIYTLVIDELEKRKHISSFIYRLREAIANIDPENFEIYIKKILEAHGYECEWNVIVPGECIEHQIDIIAKKEGLWVVECKRHFNPHRQCDLGTVLEVWARLDDLEKGFAKGKSKYEFTGAWLVTNTKYSDHGKRYAKAKDIRLTGWDYEGNLSLENLIISKKIYPVTILKIEFSIQKMLLANRIITVQDVLKSEKIKKFLKKDKLKKIISDIENLLR